MAAVRHGWHPGEVSVQERLGYADAVRQAWSAVETAMREQHRIFHSCNLPFLALTTLDDCGRPWASLVAGPRGETGFVESPNANLLTITAQLWDGDPLLDTARAWRDAECQQTARFLTAGLGIEFSTRRRNKFAGAISRVKRRTDFEYELDINVTEALGNCPKYINTRKLVPHRDARPSVVYRRHLMESDAQLPEELVRFIESADTVFVGSVYLASTAAAAAWHPSHAGMNARSGLPGFVRVSQSDGRSIVMPDYSGNRLMSSLGNIEASRLAALTIVSFTTGDVLYLSGDGEVLVGVDAREVMARQGCVVRVRATGYVFVRDALPVRQQPGTAAGRSPYSPRVKRLREEHEVEGSGTPAEGLRVLLVGAVPWAPSIATFRFRVDGGGRGLRIRPGQAVVLDFMDFIGPPGYAHMADEAPGSINDDRVRTWTVSSAHGDDGATRIELTVREVKGGVVTGALFRIVRELAAAGPRGVFVPLNVPVAADVVGVTGEFCLPPPGTKLLLVAGGIGMTPFLAMLKALAQRGEGDAVLALATKEPGVMMGLLNASLSTASTVRSSKIHLDLFISRGSDGARPTPAGYTVAVHRCRIPADFWTAMAAQDRRVFICGPDGFANAVEDGLAAAGVATSKIAREGFY